jgi:hypothetical protein
MRPMRKAANKFLEKIAAGISVKEGNAVAKKRMPMPDTSVKDFLYKQVSRKKDEYFWGIEWPLYAQKMNRNLITK